MMTGSLGSSVLRTIVMIVIWLMTMLRLSIALAYKFLVIVKSTLLQLQPGADTATIKRRYREMAVSLHPDKCRCVG